MALSRAQLANPNCVVTDSGYDAIETAIMETSRGRWFLFEYARRNRHADTNVLLSAINDIKQTLSHYGRPSHPYLVRTSFSSAYLANQFRRSPTPLQPLQAVPDAAENPPTSLQPLQVVPNIADVFEFE